MARRFYLSKIRQVEDASLGGLVWRHRLQDPGFENLDIQGGIIASDLTTGEPLHSYTLCLVGGIDHRPLNTDEELVALPVVAIDAKVSSVQTARKNRAKAEIGARLGLTDVEEVWGGADGLRDVINHYGRANWPEFDVDNFDLDDL